jgi:hypothetical protein
MQTSQLLVVQDVPTGTRHVFVYTPQLRDLQLKSSTQEPPTSNKGTQPVPGEQ